MGHARPARPADRPSPGCRPTRSGAVLPRTPRRDARLWALAAAAAAARRGARPPRAERRARARGPAAARRTSHGGISRQLALVATFPQLEYPRADRQPGRGGDRAAAVGAALRRRWSCRPATTRSCWSRPSTSQDPDGTRCCAPRSRGWPTSRCACSPPPTGAARLRSRSPTPPNARLVDWLSYARTMPRCAAVVCHAGHGTVARALASGVPVVACPARGRHGGERRPRALGRRGRLAAAPPRTRARGIRLAVRRLLAEPATPSGRASCATGRGATTARRMPPTPSSSSRQRARLDSMAGRWRPGASADLRARRSTRRAQS